MLVYLSTMKEVSRSATLSTAWKQEIARKLMRKERQTQKPRKLMMKEKTQMVFGVVGWTIFYEKVYQFTSSKIRGKSRTFGDKTLKGRLGVDLDDFGVWILVGEVNGGNGLRGYLMAYTASKTL